MKTIRYGSVCSGVEAASLAWQPLGWEPAFFAEVEPFPCAVLQQRFNATKPLRPLAPAEAVDEKDRRMREQWLKQINKLPDTGTIPNLGDFTKITKEDYHGNIDLLVGGTPCFPAGNMVLTEFGYRPIEQIKVGDLVMSHNGRLCRVLNTGSKISDNVGECKVTGRPPFKVTANHPFLVAHGKRVNSRKAPDYGRVMISDADFERIDNSVNGFGCFLNVKEHQCSVPVPQFPHVYSASRLDIMEFCGWYLGDGYIRFFKGKNKKSIVLCLSEKKLIDFISAFMGKINYSWSSDKNNVYKVTIYCTALADFLLTWFGYHADGKRIPAWAYALEQTERDALLLGYTLTDGCIRQKEARYTTVSKSLAYSVADLISFSSVYYSEVNPKKEIEGRIVNQRPFYECRGRSSETTKHFRYDRYLCCRIRSFELQNNLETVYNIEVENDHSYIVNGLCVHNCQDVSVAGKRAGFDGHRSSLALDFVRLAYELGCEWFVWENVPGVFSSNGGGDFAALLSLFTGTEIGIPEQGFSSAGFVCNARRDRFGVAWRVLDAQFTRTSGFPFAVPQRRRRVFVVGYFGDWSRAAKVLLEPGCVSWYPPARIKTREVLAGCAGDGTASAIRMRAGCDGGGKGALVGDNLSHTLQTGNDQTVVEFAQDVATVEASCYKGPAGTWNERTIVSQYGNCVGAQEELAYTQNATGVMGVASINCHGGNNVNIQNETTETITAASNSSGNNLLGVMNRSTVRRLLPIEAERLMGFPDNHTRIEWNGKSADECPDAPRYKACGNSMCVNVMEWIGRRIEQFK